MSSLTRLFLSCFLPDTLVSHCKRHRPALLGRCQTLIWNPEAVTAISPGVVWKEEMEEEEREVGLGDTAPTTWPWGRGVSFAIICHPERLHLLSNKESSCRRVRNKDSEVSLPRVKGFTIIFTIRWFVTGIIALLTLTQRPRLDDKNVDKKSINYKVYTLRKINVISSEMLKWNVWSRSKCGNKG